MRRPHIGVVVVVVVVCMEKRPVLMNDELRMR